MATAPETTQDEPTRPQPADPAGWLLDGWGLPLSGPLRIAALAGRVDPQVDPAGWNAPPAAPAPAPAPAAVSQD